MSTDSRPTSSSAVDSEEKPSDATTTRTAGKEKGNGDAREFDLEPDPAVVGKRGRPDVVEQLREAYNRNRVEKMPKWLATPPTRKELARKALKWQPDLDWWETAFARAAAEGWMNGTKPSPEHPNWTAGPDFLLLPEKASKAYEANNAAPLPKCVNVAECGAWAMTTTERRALGLSRLSETDSPRCRPCQKAEDARTKAEAEVRKAAEKAAEAEATRKALDVLRSFCDFGPELKTPLAFLRQEAERRGIKAFLLHRALLLVGASRSALLRGSDDVQGVGLKEGASAEALPPVEEVLVEAPARAANDSSAKHPRDTDDFKPIF